MRKPKGYTLDLPTACTLFEIAYAAFGLVDNPNKAELATALYKVKLARAVAGPIDYTSSKNPVSGANQTPGRRAARTVSWGDGV